MKKSRPSVVWTSLLGIAVLATALCPRPGSAQVEVSAGLLVVPDVGAGGSQVGPMVSFVASRKVLGLPLYFELGTGRIDFNSLGQDYHDKHSFLALGGEWFLTQGTSRLGLRLGLGAYLEAQTVETEPSSPGGDNWIETVIPGLVLERDMGGGRRLVVRVADALLGPWFAILDPEEYGVEHRFQLVLGIRF